MTWLIYTHVLRNMNSVCITAYYGDMLCAWGINLLSELCLLPRFVFFNNKITGNAKCGKLEVNSNKLLLVTSGALFCVEKTRVKNTK